MKPGNVRVAQGFRVTRLILSLPGWLSAWIGTTMISGVPIGEGQGCSALIVVTWKTGDSGVNARGGADVAMFVDEAELHGRDRPCSLRVRSAACFSSSEVNSRTGYCLFLARKADQKLLKRVTFRNGRSNKVRLASGMHAIFGKIRTAIAPFVAVRHLRAMKRSDDSSCAPPPMETLCSLVLVLLIWHAMIGQNGSTWGENR